MKIYGLSFPLPATGRRWRNDLHLRQEHDHRSLDEAACEILYPLRAVSKVGLLDWAAGGNLAA